MKSPSTISTSTVVRGNVTGDGSLEILGRVEGSVAMTGQVIVAANAVVKGNVSATEIQVAGSILGNLTASDLLVLNAGARVVGDLSGARIGVSEGALVRGLVRTEGEPALAAPAPAHAVATRAAMPAAKPAIAAKSPFAAPAARPAPAAVAPRPVAIAPKAAPVAAPAPAPAPIHERRPVVPEPEPVEDDVDEDSAELDAPTNPPPAARPEPARAEPKHEKHERHAPPMVVPAIKGQTKGKKKVKGR